MISMFVDLFGDASFSLKSGKIKFIQKNLESKSEMTKA